MELNHRVLLSGWRDLTIASIFWVVLAQLLNLWLKGFLEVLIPLTMLSGMVGINLVTWALYQHYQAKLASRQSKANIVQ